MSLYYKENPEYLKESLNSVFGQALPPDEVVLVEDGPLTDDLYTVVTEFSDKYPVLKVIPLPVNGGLGKALNEGLKHCSYDIVVRMDTDDVSKPDRFEKQVRFMECHPEIDVCSAWIDEFQDNIDNVIATKRLPETSAEIYEYGKKRCPINHPVAAFRKKAVVAAGSTGAAMASSLFGLGRLPGIERPAIATTLPTMKKPVVMIDSGANSNCTPEMLYQFAIMGSAFSKNVLAIDLLILLYVSLFVLTICSFELILFALDKNICKQFSSISSVI